MKRIGLRLSDSLPRLRPHLPFTLILTITLALRLWFTFTYPIVQQSDYAVYYEHAIGFAGCVNVHYNPIWTIGQSLLFALPFTLFGPSLVLIGLVNTILHITTLVLLYLATIRLFDRHTAIVAAIFSLISTSELLFNNLLCTEIPSALFLSAMLYVGSRGLQNRTSLTYFGLLCGFAAYIKSNMVLLAGPFILVQSLALSYGLRQSIRRSVRVQMIALVAILPLCFYYLPAGKLTPFPAKFGRNLWLANNPYLRHDARTGLFGWHTDLIAIPEDFPVGSEERSEVADEYRSFHDSTEQTSVFDDLTVYQQDDLFRDYATGWIRANPGTYTGLLGARFAFLFFNSTYGGLAYQGYNPEDVRQPRWDDVDRRFLCERLQPISEVLYKRMISMVWIGLLLCILGYRRRFFFSTRNMPALIVVLMIIPYILIHAVNRYHIPFLGLLWIYPGHGVVAILRWAGQRFKRPQIRQGT